MRGALTLTPETALLVAAGFVLIVGGALALVIVVEWRLRRQLRRFHD